MKDTILTIADAPDVSVAGVIAIASLVIALICALVVFVELSK